MNTERVPETDAELSRRCHDKAVRSVNTENDHRPLITCECAIWGRPCPHYFWSYEEIEELKA